MKTILVTVSDDRFGWKGGKYKETQDRISEFFKNSDFEIDLAMWDFEMVKETEFYNECIVHGKTLESDVLHPLNGSLVLEKGMVFPDKKLLDFLDPSHNGRVYKPLAIKKELDKLNDGDYLIYNDCSPELWEYFLSDPSVNKDDFDLNIIRGLCDINGDILTAHVRWNHREHVKNGIPGCHTHENFTTERCMQEMGMQQYRHSLQHASGMIVLKKSPTSVKFVEDWLYWNSNIYCAGLGPEWDPLFWLNEVLQFGKVGHRHDQSISGLLLNAMNKRLVQSLDHYERPYNTHPYNFLFFCKRGHDYKFIDGNQPPTREVYKVNTSWEVIKTYR